MNILGIIPARYESTRFPGKPLARIGSKSMIQRVYEQAVQALCDVIVATDDQRIIEEVSSFHGKAVMTSSSHRSGTDRCFEAMRNYEALSGKKIDAVINIQGDEPFISPKSIALLANTIGKNNKNILTLIKNINSQEELHSTTIPKVITDIHGKAIYFSRFTIPFQRNLPAEHWLGAHPYFKHIGIYAYTASMLETLTALEPSSLEKAESLEQLRWIENGFAIYTEITEEESISVDTPDDLERLLKEYAGSLP